MIVDFRKRNSLPKNPKEGSFYWIYTSDGKEEIWFAPDTNPEHMKCLSSASVGNGKSAYDIAVEYGFDGSEEEWLDSLKGDSLKFDELTDEEKEELRGKSAYEIAVDNGFDGSEGEWLDSLKSTENVELTDSDMDEIVDKVINEIGDTISWKEFS